MSSGPFRRILVAVKDPGKPSLPAVTQAARLARLCGAELEIFQAIKASIYPDAPSAYEAAVENLHNTERHLHLQRLGRLAARLRLHNIRVSISVEYDYPAYEAIVRRAKLIGADLIVAGRHESGSFARLTDRELLRRSPLPVLLVKRCRPYHHPNVLAAVDPQQAHDKPAQLDANILEAGAELARVLAGKLHAIHAFTPLVTRSVADALGEDVATRVRDLSTAQAGGELRQLLRDRYIPDERRYLVEGAPAAAIEATARRIHADIVVLGAMARSGLRRVVIGNTAERLIDRLPSDVLIVKPPLFATRVSGERKGPRVVTRPVWR